MIAIDRQAAAPANHDADFTTSHYRELLRLAGRSYAFATYEAIPWGGKFVLWRHDCDYSLNRALALARIEHEEGVRATYFVNPHCEFYNLLEASQLDIVRELAALGHDIGLHFDCMFHATADEAQLERQLRDEVQLLSHAVGTVVKAFSFHNPTAFHLGCEKDEYAGLVNCYSLRFKTQVPYCSDSNGYWRFRRLRDVLESAQDPCLQVLTHPGWWQEVPMRPRERVSRAVHGRAHAILEFSDRTIDAGGRDNPTGTAPSLRLLRRAGHPAYPLLDYLMHQGHRELLFLECFRLLHVQARTLVRHQALTNWGVTNSQWSAWWRDHGAGLDPAQLFSAAFGVRLGDAAQVAASEWEAWGAQARLLARGSGSESVDAEPVLQAVDALAAWGQRLLRTDGLAAVDATAAQEDPGRWRAFLEALG